jgi:FkbM family methyltransferase
MGMDIHFFTYSQLINLFEEIFIYQVYFFETTNTSPTVIDCGSNIGLSVLYFKKVYPGCQVLAFEPDGETFSLLQKNIKCNALTHITLHNVALSDCHEDGILYKKQAQPGSLNMSLFATGESDIPEKISERKLSDYIQAEVDLIKIDVEGAEISIIEDLENNNKIKLANRIIIEYHPELNKTPIEGFLKKLSACHFSNRLAFNERIKYATEIMVYSEGRNT